MKQLELFRVKSFGSIVAPGSRVGWQSPIYFPTCCGRNLQTIGDVGVRCCACGAVYRLEDDGSWRRLVGFYVVRG